MEIRDHRILTGGRRCEGRFPGQGPGESVRKCARDRSLTGIGLPWRCNLPRQSGYRDDLSWKDLDFFDFHVPAVVEMTGVGKCRRLPFNEHGFGVILRFQVQLTSPYLLWAAGAREFGKFLRHRPPDRLRLKLPGTGERFLRWNISSLSCISLRILGDATPMLRPGRSPCYLPDLNTRVAIFVNAFRQAADSRLRHGGQQQRESCRTNACQWGA